MKEEKGFLSSKDKKPEIKRRIANYLEILKRGDEDAQTTLESHQKKD